jgi:hypothetical protein
MAGENSWTALLEGWWAKIKAAFMRSVRSIIDFAQIGRIAERLERGDIEGAVKEVGLDPVSFRDLGKAIEEAFEDGGKFTAKRIPAIKEPDGHRLNVQFDVRTPVAERILKEESSKLVSEIVDDQRNMIRETLRKAMKVGQNPREAALDLVGRINPVTKQRSGGSIGLTSTQEEWVRRYEADLRSTNPRAALSRTLRDKRFDPSVMKAAKDGVPLKEDAIQKMVIAYKNRALRYRAEAIARTESLSSLHQAKMEALRQAVEKGLDPSTITMTWRTAGDKRVRHTHQGMNGQVIKYGEKFVSPSGARLAFPGDPSAPAAESINCRCLAEEKIDFLKGLK